MPNTNPDKNSTDVVVATKETAEQIQQGVSTVVEKEKEGEENAAHNASASTTSGEAPTAVEAGGGCVEDSPSIKSAAFKVPDSPAVASTSSSQTPRSSSTSSLGHKVPVPLTIVENEREGNITLADYERLDDPLRNLTFEMSPWNKFKLYGLGWVIIPARLVGVVGILSVGVLAGKIAQAGLPKPKKARKKEPSSPTSAEEPEEKPVHPKPLRGWRRMLAGTIFTLARGLLFTFGFHRIKVIGKPDPNATVIVANHCGPFEATAILHHSRATLVSRVENIQLPLFGTILQSIQCIFVNRNSAVSRDDTVSQIHERAKAPKGTWPPLLIFPEGTTGNGKSIMRFRTGAFLPGVPVQPIVCRFPYKHFDCSWSDERLTAGALFLRSLSQFYNPLTLEYLPTYVPSEAEKADPSLYAENVRQYMCQKSGIPPSKYSLEDYIVLAEALKYNIPPPEALLGMEMLRKESHITASDVKKIIKAFGELDQRRSGRIGYGAFLRYLNMPDTVVTRTIFAEVMSTNAVAAAAAACPGGCGSEDGHSNASGSKNASRSESPGLTASTDCPKLLLGNLVHSTEAVYELLTETDFTQSLSSPTAVAAPGNLMAVTATGSSSSNSSAADKKKKKGDNEGPVKVDIKKAYRLEEDEKQHPKASITFRQFLRAIIKINRTISTEDKLAQAFDIVNFTGSGALSREELVAVFTYVSAAALSARQNSVHSLSASASSLGKLNSVSFDTDADAEAHGNEIFNKADVEKKGSISKEQFETFMKNNPMYLALFEATRKYEREKDAFHNPVLQACEAKARGTPMTVPEFNAVVKAYRQEMASAHLF